MTIKYPMKNSVSILSELDTFQETKAKLRTTQTPKDDSLLQEIALKKSQSGVKSCLKKRQNCIKN